MRFFNYLNEEYVATGKATLGLQGKQEPFDIFINPTSKELMGMRKIEQTVRYIADFKNKNLYVWPSSYIHVEGLIALKDVRGLKTAFDPGGFDYLSTGAAEIEGNKLKFLESDGAWALVSKPWTNMNDKWLNTWFTKPYTKTFLDKFHKKGINEKWESSIKIR